MLMRWFPLGLLAMVAVAVVAVGPAAEGSAPPAVVAPSPLPSLSCAGVPHPEPMPADPGVSGEAIPGYPDLGSALSPRRVELGEVDLAGWESSGPRIVYSDSDYRGRDDPWGHDAFLVDLEAGTSGILATARNGWQASLPDIDGRDVAWTEVAYEDGEHWTGRTRWRVMATTLDGRERPRVVERGAGRRLIGAAASYPLARVSEGRVAWSEEDRAAGELPWRIVVADLATGERLAVFRTGWSLWTYDLAGDRVAWTEARLDGEGYPLETRLMLGSIADGSVVEVARSGWELRIDEDRLAWRGDPTPDGSDPFGVILTLPLEEPAAVPTVLSPAYVADGEHPSLAPDVGEGLVTFIQERDIGTSILAWDSRSGLGATVDGSNGYVSAAIGGGWLTWHSDGRFEEGARGYAAGVPLDELRAAILAANYAAGTIPAIALSPPG